MKDCAEVRPYLQAYVDSELSPERCIALEQHLAQCPECAAEVEVTRSLCRATRLSVTGNGVLCPRFRARLAAQVGSERRRQERRQLDPLSWPVVVPLAAAAGFLLFLTTTKAPLPDFVTALIQTAGSSASTPDDTGPWHDDLSPQLAHAASNDGLVDFLIRHHAARYKPEVVEPALVNHLESQLGFRLRPPDLQRYGARFEGANLVHLHRTRAAILHYKLGGKRITLTVYNPEELPLRAHRALTPRVVGNRAVFVGHRRGYSIATCESQGVGYAVTADLSGDESAELVAALDM